MSERLLRVQEVADRLGVARVTVYRWWQDGTLPVPRRRIGGNSVGVLESELTDWLRSRPVVAGVTRGGGDGEPDDE